MKIKHIDRYDHFIIHCTATPPNLNIGAAWVNEVHSKKGWRGCGYHAIITRDGIVETSDRGYKARPYWVTGAHVGGCGPGWNKRSLGIALVGGIDKFGRPENNFTGKQYEGLAHYLMMLLEAHKDGDNVKILGHRDLIALTHSSPKACPCFDVKNILVTDLGIGHEETKEGNPAMDIPKVIEVKAGDTLWKIGCNYGLDFNDIMKNNGLNSFLIKVGEKLRLIA